MFITLGLCVFYSRWYQTGSAIQHSYAICPPRDIWLSFIIWPVRKQRTKWEGIILKSMYCGSPNRNVSTLYHRTVNSILYWNYEIMQMQIMIIEKGLIAEESIVILLANRRKRFIIEHDSINNNYAAIMTCVFACPSSIWICLKECLSASGTLTFWSLRWKRICLDGVSAVLISQTAPSEAKPNFPRIRSWQTNDMLISVPTCSRLQLLGRAKPPCGSTAVLRFSAKCSGSFHTLSLMISIKSG